MLAQPLRARVQPAHNSLQLCEFLHQFRRQIGLRQLDGLQQRLAIDRRSPLVQQTRQLFRDLQIRPRLVPVAAQLLVEGHRLQHLHPVFQRSLLIHRPEEARVAEARPQHPLVPVPDHIDAHLFRVRIQHRQKTGFQLSRGILHGKIFLVIPHYRHQHFFGQLQIFGIEVAQHHRRPLRQVRHRLQQRGVLAPAAAGHAPRLQIQRLADAVLPQLHIRRHLGRLQHAHIVVRVIDGYRRIAAQNTVPPRQIRRAHAGKFNRQDRVIEQRHHPPHRPHKTLRLQRPPVHGFRPVERGQFRAQQIAQHLAGLTPAVQHIGRDVLALRRRNFFERLHANARLARKSLRCRCRLPIFERHTPRRPRRLAPRIRLPGQHAIHLHRQPPRRRVTVNLVLVLEQPLPPQQLHHPLGQLRLSRRDHARRNLFKPRFEQKIRHRYRPPAFCRCVA